MNLTSQVNTNDLKIHFHSQVCKYKLEIHSWDWGQAPFAILKKLPILDFQGNILPNLRHDAPEAELQLHDGVKP